MYQPLSNKHPTARPHTSTTTADLQVQERRDTRLNDPGLFVGHSSVQLVEAGNQHASHGFTVTSPSQFVQLRKISVLTECCCE